MTFLKPEIADAMIDILADGPASEAWAQKATKAYRADPTSETATALYGAVATLPRSRQQEIWTRVKLWSR